ncbi:hypothetical protein HYU14_03110 [Candidatus Woesearchaeota archaeon]|nr:hypothetical protein [Candidatus Woesearchaeota archaeon]
MGIATTGEVSLEGIINRHPGYLVFDTSFFISFGVRLSDHLDSAGSFDLLDENLLIQDIQETKNLIAILAGNEYLLCPSKVINEYEEFIGHLKSRQMRLTFLMENLRQNGQGESNPIRASRSSSCGPRYLLVNQAIETYSLLCTMLKRRELSYDYGDEAGDFNDLFNLLVTYSQTMGLKERKRYFNDGRPNNKANDEHIIAAGVYFMLLNKVPVSFYSQDIDFPTIISFLDQVLFSPEFPELSSHSYFRNVQELVTRNPLIHYFLRLDGQRNPSFNLSNTHLQFGMSPMQRREIQKATFGFYLKKRGIFLNGNKSIY